MNIETQLLALTKDSYTLVSVVFASNPEKQYAYKAPKEMYISEGDFVVVETAKGMQVVKVVGEATVDLDAPYQYKWIVDKVYLETYKMNVARDNKIRKELKAALVEEELEKIKESIPETVRKRL